MEENKNLVVSYYYHVEKENPKETEVHKRLDDLSAQITSNGLNSVDIEEVGKLMLKSFSLGIGKRVKVYKEYPEFLVKDFKTKEELYDFLDKEDSMIPHCIDFFFKNIPDCLKEIGITGENDESTECEEYIKAKHFKGGE